MKRSIISTLAAVAVIASAALFGAVQGQAETPNYSVAIPGVVIVPVHLSGQYTVTTADVAQFKLPFSGQLIGVSATSRVSGGTAPTLDIDVQDDGVSVLSAAISITAGTVSEGAVTTAGASIADESVFTIDLAITGTSPTWDDITVLLTIVRT